MKFIVARGIRHCGNEEWATQWAAAGPNRVFISHENIRSKMFGQYTPLTKPEKRQVSEEFHAAIEEALTEGKDVVVAVLGLSADGLRHYRNTTKRFKDVEFEIRNFDMDLAEALARHLASDDEKYGISERAIKEMHQKFAACEIPSPLRKFVID